MAGYSGLDFPNVGSEITYWLGHTTSTFKGGYSGSGENGNDFSMPTGTPVYAITSGTVVGQGYYGGGGVVSIQQYPGRVWYYQHLDLNEASVGQPVQAGQLIGYSGGQNQGGNHPSTTEFSTYPHIEVGIDAPWSGIWGGGPNVGPNIDPRPVLETLLVSLTGGSSISTTSTPTSAGGAPLSFTVGGTTQTSAAGASTCVKPSGFDVWNPIAWAQYAQCLFQQGAQSAAQAAGTFQHILQFVNVIFNDPTRFFKGILGVGFIISSFIIFILPDAADVAISAAGAPELGSAARQTLAHPLQNPAKSAKRGVQAYSQVQKQKVQAQRNYANYQRALTIYNAKYADRVARERQRRMRVQVTPSNTNPPSGSGGTQPPPSGSGGTQPPPSGAGPTGPSRAGPTAPSASTPTRPVGPRIVNLPGNVRRAMGALRPSKGPNVPSKPPKTPPAPKIPATPAQSSTATPSPATATPTPAQPQAARRLPTLADARAWLKNNRRQRQQMLHRQRTQRLYEQQAKIEQQLGNKFRAPPGTKESMDDIAASLRGEKPAPSATKVAGTERGLTADKATLKSLKGLRSVTTDPKVLAGLDRDIATLEKRIAEMEGK